MPRLPASLLHLPTSLLHLYTCLLRLNIDMWTLHYKAPLL